MLFNDNISVYIPGILSYDKLSVNNANNLKDKIY